MTRKLIALTPVLLIAGIVVQVVALLLIVILWVPCLIWPGILNRPYQRITKAGVRLVTRAMIGNGRKERRVTEAETGIAT